MQIVDWSFPTGRSRAKPLPWHRWNPWRNSGNRFRCRARSYPGWNWRGLIGTNRLLPHSQFRCGVPAGIKRVVLARIYDVSCRQSLLDQFTYPERDIKAQVLFHQPGWTDGASIVPAAVPGVDHDAADLQTQRSCERMLTVASEFGRRWRAHFFSEFVRGLFRRPRHFCAYILCARDMRSRRRHGHSLTGVAARQSFASLPNPESSSATVGLSESLETDFAGDFAAFLAIFFVVDGGPSGAADTLAAVFSFLVDSVFAEDGVAGLTVVFAGDFGCGRYRRFQTGLFVSRFTGMGNQFLRVEASVKARSSGAVASAACSAAAEVP